METQSKLVAALVKARLEFKPISKDSSNPFHKSKYASLDSVLDAVMPALCANGLAIVQSMQIMDGMPVLVTSLIHESSEERQSVFPLPSTQDSQKLGAAMTYARRYSICALLNVTADEDDDGNGSSELGSKKGQQSQPKPTASSKPAPAKPSRPTTEQPADNGKRAELMDKSAALLAELGWSGEDGKEYLKQAYNKRSRQLLTDSELEDFCQKLAALTQEADFEPEI